MSLSEQELIELITGGSTFEQFQTKENAKEISQEKRDFDNLIDTLHTEFAKIESILDRLVLQVKRERR